MEMYCRALAEVKIIKTRSAEIGDPESSANMLEEFTFPSFFNVEIPKRYCPEILGGEKADQTDNRLQCKQHYYGLDSSEVQGYTMKIELCSLRHTLAQTRERRVGGDALRTRICWSRSWPCLPSNTTQC